MTVHLIKMSVGVESVDHLARIQAERLLRARRQGVEPVLRHFTRNTPKQAGDLVNGGSIYWVIRGFVRVRQGLGDIERHADDDGRPLCALCLDPVLVKTELRAHKPFQGWRYLRAEEAPPDVRAAEGSAPGIPEEMAAELRSLGLL